MAKKGSDIPADMWLHVATDALARYVATGATVEVAEATDRDGTPAIVIMVPVARDDPRIAPDFTALFAEHQEVTSW